MLAQYPKKGSSDSVLGDSFNCRFNWAINVATSDGVSEAQIDSMCLNAG